MISAFNFEIPYILVVCRSLLLLDMFSELQLMLAREILHIGMFKTIKNKEMNMKLLQLKRQELENLMRLGGGTPGAQVCLL